MTDRYYNQSAYNAHHNAPADIDISGLLAMIWQKKLLLLLVFACGFVLTLWASTLIKTKFTAHSIVLVRSERASSQIEELVSLVKSSSFNTASILTEIEVFKSRTLAERVVKRLDLATDNEFTSGSMSQAKEAKIESSVSKFLDHLSVASVPGSLAVRVSFTSKSPQKAAFITNAIVDEYFTQRLEAQDATQSRLAEWLNKRLVELRQQVMSVERKVEKFRVDNNLVATEENVVVVNNIEALNRELIDAQAKYLDAKIKLEQSQRASGRIDNLSAMQKFTNAGLVKDLELQKVKLSAELSELSNRYGDKHPTMVNKQDELRELERKIDQEFNKATRVLRNDLNIAKARVSELEKEITEAEKDITQQVTHNGDALVVLRELERESEASQMVLKTFLETYKKTLGRNDLQDPGAKILSHASIPQEPSSPKKALIISLGTFLSLLMGFMAALIVGKLDTRIRTLDNLRAATALKCSAVIPWVRGLPKNNLPKYITSNPSSPMAEAIRDLYLETQKADSPAKVISFLSASRFEGKTALSVMMATIIAKSGRRVIMIDGNMRGASVNQAMNLKANATLVEYLSGHKNLEDVIVKDADTGMHVIFAQAIPNTAFDLLNSKKMKALISALREQYDHVIIDTPAIGEVADAKILSRFSDHNVFIANWNKTRSEAIQKAMKNLSDIPLSQLSIVLNKAKRKL